MKGTLFKKYKKGFLSTLMLAFVALTIKASAGPGLITNNDLTDRFVEVSNEICVWEEITGPTDQIRGYNLEQCVPFDVVDNGFHHSFVALSGKVVIYVSYREGKRGLYLKVIDKQNNTVGPEVTVVPNTQEFILYPYVDRNRIVWSQQKRPIAPFKLRYCEFDENTGQCGNYQTFNSDFQGKDMVLQGNSMFYIDKGGSNNKDSLFAIDLDHPDQPVLIDSDPVVNYLDLSVSGNRLVWTAGGAGSNQSIVRYAEIDAAYNLVNRRDLFFSQFNRPYEMLPRISGNQIVFRYATLNPDNSIDLEILKHDLNDDTQTFLQPLDDLFQSHPVINGHRYLYEDLGESGFGKNTEIAYGIDLYSGIEAIGHASSGGADNCAPESVLATNGVPTAGNQLFSFLVHGMPANSNGYFLVSSSVIAGGFDFLGLSIYVNLFDLDLTIPFQSDAFGDAHIAFPLDISWAGIEFFTQAFVANTDECGGGGTWSATGALKVTIQP